MAATKVEDGINVSDISEENMSAVVHGGVVGVSPTKTKLTDEKRVCHKYLLSQRCRKSWKHGEQKY